MTDANIPDDFWATDYFEKTGGLGSVARSAVNPALMIASLASGGAAGHSLGQAAGHSLDRTPSTVPFGANATAREAAAVHPANTLGIAGAGLGGVGAGLGAAALLRKRQPTITQ